MKEIPFNSNSIYEVLYICDFLDKYRHKMFHVKCKKCAWEGNIRKYEINHTEECNHTDHMGFYTKIVRKTSHTRKRLYSILSGMKERCYNKEDKNYKFYGGKGISICEEWLNDKDVFVEWALLNGYVQGLTIDRIDENKNYCPENCRWVSRANNAKYKSTTTILRVENESHTGTDWAKILRLGVCTINRMLREYGEDTTIQFIKARRQHPDLVRHSHQKWLDVYNIPH